MAVGPVAPALSPEQWAAVTAPDGPLVIRAGAGTGKTTVLVERVVHLITARGVRPATILVVTFSRRARQELVDRLAVRLPGPGQAAAVTTLHALGRKIIQQWPAAAGYRPGYLATYTRRDADLVLREALRALGVAAPDPQTDRVLTAIEGVRLGLPATPDVPDGAWTGDLDLAALAGAYEAVLRQRNAIDFVSMVTLPPRLLAAEPAALALLQVAYAHLLLDEAQDVSRDQIALIKQLAAGHRNLTIVGDAAQAVYGFRGGDPRLLTDFGAHYPDAHHVVLTANYRSTAPIVAAGNALATGLAAGPTLVSALGAGLPVVGHQAADPSAEATWVADQIRRLRTTGAISSAAEVAVLVRTHTQGAPIATALRAAGIPVRLRRSGAELAAHPVVADALAHLRLLADPDDTIALRRVLDLPPRGLRLLAGALDERPVTALADVQALATRLDAALGHAAADGCAARLTAFLEALTLPPAPGRSPAATLDALLDRTGYLAWLSRQPGAADRLAVLDQLRRLLARVTTDLATWLAEAVADEAPPPPEADAVTLATIHSTKGMEFAVVFVVGLEEGVLPDYRSLDDSVALAQEQAVAYVAVTRARARLFLSWCATRQRGGAVQPTQPSRFVRLLPADDLSAG